MFGSWSQQCSKLPRVDKNHFRDYIYQQGKELLSYNLFSDFLEISEEYKVAEPFIRTCMDENHQERPSAADAAKLLASILKEMGEDPEIEVNPFDA